MQFLSPRQNAVALPSNVVQFKSMIGGVRDQEHLESAMNFFIKSISNNVEKYPDEYKIRADVSSLIKKIKPFTKGFFKSAEKVNFLFSFLEKAFKCYKASKKTNEVIFSIIMDTAESDDPQVLQYGSLFLQTALENGNFYAFMFTKEKLAQVFQNCFCYYPNTRLFYSPLISSSTSSKVFTNISNLTQFMEKVSTMLHDGNIEPKSSYSALTFVGYIIRSLDTGNFLPEILPYVVEIAPLCDSLSFFKYFLQAPSSQPSAVWSALNEIMSDANTTIEHMNTALIAIEQSGIIPNGKFFSFKPFIMKNHVFTNDQKKMLLALVKKCNPDVISDFVSNVMPLSATKIDVQSLLELCQTTQFDTFLPTVIDNFIVFPDIHEFEICDDEVFEVIESLTNQITDSYKPKVDLFERILTISSIKWNPTISTILTCVFVKMKAETFMPSLVSFLKNGLSESVIYWFCEHLFFQSFVEAFIENKGISIFETLMKTLCGRDFIARLAYFRPSDEIDEFFVNNPPENLSEEEINLLMHGLPHNSSNTDNGYLCIPSLIPYVPSFSLKTPLEKFIVGKSAGKFFMPLREQTKQYVSTYISSTLLRYQITDPDFLPFITDPRYPHFNVMQSTPIEMIKPSMFKRSTSFGFWFYMFELRQNAVTTIVSFNGGSLRIYGNSNARVGGESMFCAPNCWHYFTIVTNSDNKMLFYIDKKLLTSFPMSFGVPFFSFGNAGHNSNIYFLAPYLRISGSPYTLEHIESHYSKGPNSPTNIFIDPSNGVHYVVSNGLPKYLSTVGGPYFVFDVAMKTTSLKQFMFCLEAAFNILELGFVDKEQFIGALRFILRQKDHFEDEVIQLLREKIVNLFDITDICLFLNDFGMLRTKVESLISVAPLDSTCASHFFFVLEAYCFLELEEPVINQLFCVLEYFITFDPSYLHKMVSYICALPHIEKVEQQSIDDEKQYSRQLDLIYLFFHDFEILSSALSNEELINYMILLNPHVGAEFFSCFCQKLLKLHEFEDILSLQKIDVFIFSISKSEKTWISLFKLLTHFQDKDNAEDGSTVTDEINTFDDLLKIKPNLSIVHEYAIPTIFKLVADTIFKCEYSFPSLTLLMDLMHSRKLSTITYVRSIQFLCSLGCGQGTTPKLVSSNDKTNNNGNTHSSSLSTSNSLRFEGEKNAGNNVTSNILSSNQRSLYANSSLSHKELTRKSYDSLADPHSLFGSLLSQKQDLISGLNTNSSCLVDDFEEIFDPELVPILSKILDDCIIVEEDVQIPETCFENESNPPEDYMSDPVRYIIDIVIETLLESVEDPSEFATNLIPLTLQGSDVCNEVAVKFHQNTIIQLLKQKAIKKSQDCLNELLSFLTFRIIEGWWKDRVDELFENVVSILLKPSIQASNFIFTVFSQKKQNSLQNLESEISTIYNLFTNSKFFSIFQSNSSDYSIFVQLTTKNGNEMKATIKMNEINSKASSNISKMNKIRKEIASKCFRKEKISLFTKQIIESTFCRRMVRYQFFWHLNRSASFLNKAVSLIHLQRLKTKFTVGIPDKFMVSTSSSPLCVPIKLMPCVFTYDNSCQKMTKLLSIPKSVHKSIFKSYLPEITVDFTAPFCFTGWKLPLFINIYFSVFAKAVFSGTSEPFEAQMLGTPEACQCVVVLSDKTINVILNCYLSGETPNTENLCHYPLFEETMAGYFGTPSIFFNKPSFSVPLNQITMVIPRRYVHSPTAVDFYTISGVQISLVTSIANRKLLINHLKPKYTKVAKTGPLFAKRLLEKPLNVVIKKWSKLSISNFQYLLYLNSVGNRSFNDYSQYPIFPWIVSDYKTEAFPPPLRDLSKPLGQISEKRSKKFDRVFKETDNSYFYGTHYSYPAAVLHYMMRAEPFTIFNVVLHSGFDHRDRLFSSIMETWNTCSEVNTTDLKELIPQFYCFPSMFENMNKLQLQTRSDGTDINRVRLPPWGKSSTFFVFNHRKILESKKMNNTLPLWIDLIFGYKQRGPAAVEAKNVFLPISYDYPEKDNDDVLTAADIDTILNFGQCPLQIMTSPHALRSNSKYSNISNSFTRHCIVKSYVNEDIYNISICDHEILHSNSRLSFNIKNKILTVSERKISFGSQQINSDTLIDIVSAAVSKDQTLLTIITTFGKIDTYSLLYDTLESVSTTCLPDIIPLLSVDVSSHYGLIVIASETHIALVDLHTGFLLCKYHGEYSKVVFDEAQDIIIALSRQKRFISVFSLTLDLIFQPEKNCLMDFDEITAISPKDTNYWRCNTYFATGHKNGIINVWKTRSCSLTCQTLCKAESEIRSILIFSRGKALAYSDSKGNIGVVSACEKNKRDLLKASFFEKCSICSEKIKQQNVCSVCKLPCCKLCMTKQGCLQCQDFALRNNGSYNFSRHQTK